MQGRRRWYLQGNQRKQAWPQVLNQGDDRRVTTIICIFEKKEGRRGGEDSMLVKSSKVERAGKEGVCLICER